MSTILVIEDEAQVRANVCEILELGGFQTIAASNGRIGVALARQHLPDAIFCDVAMPELDGYQVLAVLRQDIATSSIPIILLTARSERQDMRRGMQLGADDYLTKPFTPEELLNAVDARLQRRDVLAAVYDERLAVTEAKLQHLNDRDPITGLATAQLLAERFAIWQQQAAEQYLTLSLIVLGIDQFSRIRSSYGHVVTNTLTAAIASRLNHYFHNPNFPGEVLLAHLSADRFAILLAPLPHREAVEAIATSLCQALSGTAQIERQELYITPSLGIAEARGGDTDLNPLLARAEAALEAAQRRGGQQHNFYDASLTAGSPRYLQIEADLRHALTRHELQLYYQPQVELASGRIMGAEALLRWFHAELGMVPPAEFIAIAETTGLANLLGNWVLQAATEQALAWQQQKFAPLTIAINLSARQLHQASLVQNIKALLARTGLQPSQLALELTESAVVEDIAVAAAAIAELRALNFSVAIDDFGTGYSSLEYLQHLDADTLKLDRCFVCNIHRNAANAAIVDAFVRLAMQLNKRVVIEGIETAAELEFLRRHYGNTLGQGYYFSRPLPATEFERLCRQQTSSSA